MYDQASLPSPEEADALLADLMSSMIDSADSVADLRAGKTDRLFEGIKVIGYCPICGKPITERRGKGRQKIFCSSICRNRYNHLHRDERTRTGMAKKFCECCGKEFTAYRENSRPQKYCSIGCATKAAWKRRKGSALGIEATSEKPDS